MGSPLTPDAVNEFFVAQYPAAALSGNRCVATGDRMATACWTFDGSQLRPGGYISGPTQFALADCALWFAVFTEIGLEAMAVTSQMSINFLKPATGGDLYAEARLLKVGRSTMVGSIRLWVGEDIDDLVAAATGTYVAPRGNA